MNDEFLKSIQPTLEALVQLFHPLLEIAVHDLENGKIVLLYNNYSRRQVGDLTPLRELGIDTADFPDVFPPYYKENWDGRPLKCTSVTLRDSNHRPVGLVCFNYDTSIFRNFQVQLQEILRVESAADSPIEMFSENWREQIDRSIRTYLVDEGATLEHLSRIQRRSLVKHLYDKGIFNFKNAPSYVAQKLKVSRASVYNYLA